MFGVGVVVALVLVALVVIFVIVPRLTVPDWGWRPRAGPLSSRLASQVRPVVSVETLEKVCLLGLLCIIFASILPGIDATVLQVLVGITAIVLVNAVISPVSRGGLEYAALLATNLMLVYIANALLGERREFEALGSYSRF